MKDMHSFKHLLLKVAQLFLIFIFSLHTKIKQGAENDRETRFISNPSKPLSNKCSLTMNPAHWNRCKQGLRTHICAHTHTAQIYKEFSEKTACRCSWTHTELYFMTELQQRKQVVLIV